MNASFGKFWQAARHMIDSVIDRLPALIVGIVAFFLFYALSFLAARFVARAVSRRRQNLGVVFARLIQGATVMIGLLVSFSIIAPSFQASD